MRRVRVTLAVILLSGCAGLGQVERVSDLSPQQLRDVNNIKLYESDQELKYTSIGRIKGLSCKGSAYSGSVDKEGAMMQLRIKAVKLSANGVLFPTCSHDSSVDWGNNCWESWVCIGEAVHVQ